MYLTIVKKENDQWVIDQDSVHLFEKFANKHTAVVIMIDGFRAIDSTLSTKKPHAFARIA